MSESISETARRILDCSIRGQAWPVASVARLIEEAASEEGSGALFGILAEGLADQFEPRLVDAYAALFSEVIASALPGWSAAELLARYQRVRRPRRFEGDPEAVYVFSRVTLGADVAITSLVLDAAKRRFPAARIVLAGGEKSYRLFAGDPRIEHLPVAYQRGTLRQRLEACPRIEEHASIVIDPDSRLTQLGLVPVCPEESYYFFESRAYGADGEESLGALGDHGLDAIVDSGPGGEEQERVRRAIGERQDRMRMFEGSFAGFAAIIARSRLYAGYDSAGQHAAAACGVPLVTMFAGFPCPRFAARWRPTGPGRIEVIQAADRDPERVLEDALEAVDRLLRPC